MKKLIGLSAFVLILTSHGIVFGSTCSSGTVAALLEEGQNSYRKRLDISEAKKSLDLFMQATVADPTCAEAFANASKAAWWVGDLSTVKKERMETFQKGVELGKQAVLLDSKSAAAHFWLAGNNGSYGETRGVLKSLFLVKPIRKDLNEVLAIDPNFEGGAAYRVLGVVDYKVPGFAGGSRKRALEQLQKAYSIDPKNPITQYYLAEYFDVVGDKKKEAEYLDQLDGLTPSEDHYPDWMRMKEKGAVLRKKLKPR